MELTPAHVQSVASFYDMYHLEPVGRHSIEVCTNLSCALVGAQAVRRCARGGARAWRRARRPTTARSRFRLVECAGGCGYAPVVVVDQRYREPVRPDDVPALVEEIRGR